MCIHWWSKYLGLQIQARANRFWNVAISISTTILEANIESRGAENERETEMLCDEGAL